MAMVAATIQQSHGLVEAHFGVFVVIALLLYYRDWLPVVVAAAAIAVHHLAAFWMQSRGLPVLAFESGGGFGIVALHAAYVAVETGFVCVMAMQLRGQLVALGHDPHQLCELAGRIAGGEPVPAAVARTRFAEGSLAAAPVRMGGQIQERGERERASNEFNARTRVAVDASRTAIMIADDEHVIRYVNRSLVELLRQQQAALRSRFPDFDVDNLVGTSIHRFHVDPDRIRGLLNALERNLMGRIQVGGAHFNQMITPVTGADGARIGFVVEWHDRTDELKLEQDLSRIIAAAAAGDLGQRVHVDPERGFFASLGDGINRFLDATQQGLHEVRHLLAALSEGRLDQRIERQLGGDFGRMKDDANGTADRLAEIIGQLQQASARIDGAAGEIAAGNGELSRRTEQQAASLEETAASMEEMTATVRQNAEHAR